MKRPMTLVAFILTIVMLSIDAILELIGIAFIFEIFAAAEAPGMIILGVIALITIALIVVSLVFNILGITAWNKDAQGYQKKRKFVITAVVLNFVLVLLMLISMFTGAFSVMSVLLLLALVAGNVLAIVDLAREKKKVAQAQTAEATDAE